MKKILRQSVYWKQLCNTFLYYPNYYGRCYVNWMLVLRQRITVTQSSVMRWLMILGTATFLLMLLKIYVSFLHTRTDKELTKMRLGIAEQQAKQEQLLAEWHWITRPDTIWQAAHSRFQLHAPQLNETFMLLDSYYYAKN